MADSFPTGIRKLRKFGKNIRYEVPKHAVKASATRLKYTVKRFQPFRVFKNFGGTGKSRVGTGVNYRLSGSGWDTVATVKTYGPFKIQEYGAEPHLILPVGGRGTIMRKGQLRSRTRKGARGMAERRIKSKRGFRYLQAGVSAQQQNALFFGGRYSAYAPHPGTKAHHPWAKGVAVFKPQARAVFQRSVVIGMRKTIG